MRWGELQHTEVWGAHFLLYQALEFYLKLSSVQSPFKGNGKQTSGCQVGEGLKRDGRGGLRRHHHEAVVYRMYKQHRELYSISC